MPFPVKTILCLLCISLSGLALTAPAPATAKVPGSEGIRPVRPRLVVSDIRSRTVRGHTVFSFRISQEAQTPGTLQVPLLIKTGVGDFHYTRPISSAHTDLAFSLPGPPLTLIIDPYRQLKRQLTPPELPPVWSRFLQAKEITAVLPTSNSSVYAPLLKSLGGRVKILTSEQFKNAMLGNSTLLFLGTDNPAGRSLFGKTDFPAAGFSLDVHSNPLAPEHLAARAVSSSSRQTRAALGTLPGTGDFSSIHCEDGRIIDRSRISAESGQIYPLERLPSGAPSAALEGFYRLIDRLAASRVVYVGEIHNSTADHLLEFRIIQALYKKNPHLAIGMEMFPATSQRALDAYILGDTGMSEQDFLKKSKYFQTWRYDFRLFRNIFNFARRYRITVVGLNIDREIVSRIFKTGSTDGLSPEQKRELPGDRDLDMPGYADRLREILGIHTEEMKVHGTAAGFIQAQAVWDETMAEHIVSYLTRHPATRMVVLAGVQHVRDDSGIPPRVKRRLRVSQSTVVNISSQDQYSQIPNIADYFFMEQAQPLSPPARIGLVLAQITHQGRPCLKIDGFNPPGQAETAGLKKNDIVLAIDGNRVYDMADVRIAMIDVEPGDTVTVTVRRKETSDRQQEISYRVKTHSSLMSRVHPW